MFPFFSQPKQQPPIAWTRDLPANKPRSVWDRVLGKKDDDDDDMPGPNAGATLLPLFAPRGPIALA